VNMATESLGIVSADRFRSVLEDLRVGKEAPLVPVLRTLVLERWLRNRTSEATTHITPQPAASVQTRKPRLGSTHEFQLAECSDPNRKEVTHHDV